VQRRRAKIIPDLGIEQSPEVEGAPEGHEVVVVNYDGRSVNLAVDGKTVWLSQKRLAELFGKAVNTINNHVLAVLKDEELDAESAIRKYRITATDGKTYEILHYSLDMALAVAIRVRDSKLASRIRVWAVSLMAEKLAADYDAMNAKLAAADAEVFAAKQEVAELKTRHALEGSSQANLDLPVVRAAPRRKGEIFHVLIAFDRPIKHVYIDMEACDVGDQTLRAFLFGKQASDEPVVLGVGSESESEELSAFLGQHGLQRAFLRSSTAI
jgi:hypothetical protein